MFVGTSQLGWAFRDRGSPTLFASEPSNSNFARPLRRASAKKSVLMLPVFVTLMVAVTGFPAGSTVLGEFGMPLLDIGGPANEIAPLNGSLRCVPSTGPLTRSVRVHRPRAGVPRKNCIVLPKFTAPLALTTPLDCSSTGWPLGSTRYPVSW